MATPTTTRPNVLLVCTDHWPGSLLGAAGHPAVLTPTLDQLAANGVRFPNAYSECPVCIPARRTLMTGLTPRGHGMNHYTSAPMPATPTVAQLFRDAGYQAYAVGKLHVQPQRQRIGFDDVLLDEEGRGAEGVGQDDYEIFLGDHGHAGQRFAGGMNNNEYVWRPWHLPEAMHVTNWAAQMMSRTIKRRDPLKPGFWYLSFCHPHPPLHPLQAYLDIYRDVEIPEPFVGTWAQDPSRLPTRLRQHQGHRVARGTPAQIAAVRRAFYALCTHIDHQLRVVIGTLRDEGLLDNTIICMTSDHGDMLGNHHLWAKQLMYEDSARVPMLLTGVAGDWRVGHHRTDPRLVGLADVAPTLLDLAGIPIPAHVEGISMVGPRQRDRLYGECGQGTSGTRMVRTERYKLVYFALGNVRQLFDMIDDPMERHDLASSPRHASVLDDLTRQLIAELYGSAVEWVREGALVGLPDQPQWQPGPNIGFSGQRGSHWPPPKTGA